VTSSAATIETSSALLPCYLAPSTVVWGGGGVVGWLWVVRSWGGMVRGRGGLVWSRGGLVWSGCRVVWLGLWVYRSSFV